MKVSLCLLLTLIMLPWASTLINASGTLPPSQDRDGDGDGKDHHHHDDEETSYSAWGVGITVVIVVTVCVCWCLAMGCDTQSYDWGTRWPGYRCQRCAYCGRESSSCQCNQGGHGQTLFSNLKIVRYVQQPQFTYVTIPQGSKPSNEFNDASAPEIPTAIPVANP